MTCESVEKVLPLYVEGDLSRRRMEAVRSHIADCPACRELCGDFRVSQRALRMWAGSGATSIGGAMLDDLRKSLWRRIEAEPVPGMLALWVERLGAAVRHWASKPTIAMAAVCAVVVGSFGLSQLDGFGGRKGMLGEDVTANALAADQNDAFALAEEPAALAGRLADLDDAVERVVNDTPLYERTAENQMRIEIQTPDPNVRIIWLTQRTESEPVGY